MCDDFGKLVSQRIIELNVLIEKATKKEVIHKGLACDCKTDLIKRYFAAVGNLMILVSSLSQNLLTIRNIEEFEVKYLEMKRVFRETRLSRIFCTDEEISCPKMTSLFLISQKQIEDVLLEEVEGILKPFIGDKNGNKHKACEEALDVVYNLAETALLSISGLRVNFFNLSDGIYVDEGFVHTECAPPLSGKHFPPKNCIYLNRQDKRKCEMFPLECVHVFLHDSYYAVNNWLDNYIRMFYKYHVKPENIAMIWDYKLLGKHDWTERENKRYLEAENKFGSVYLINTEDVNFNGKEKNLNIVDLEDIKECL
jgi:hypothetical protein